MSKCSCIIGTEWNFDIECLDTQTLKFVDYTNWNTTEPYVVPDSHEVMLTIPELDRTFRINIKPQDSTIITSKDLGLGNCIPDGIYCLEAYTCKSCKDNSWGERKLTKQVVVIPQTKCKVANLVATEDESLALKFFSKIKSLENVASVGQLTRAQDIYSDLQNELDNYSCKSCC